MVYDDMDPGRGLLHGDGSIEQIVGEAASELGDPVFAPQAMEDLRTLPPADVSRILHFLRNTGTAEGMRRVAGGNLVEARVGKYRIVFRSLVDAELRRLGRSNRDSDKPTVDIEVLAINTRP